MQQVVRPAASSAAIAVAFGVMACGGDVRSSGTASSSRGAGGDSGRHVAADASSPDASSPDASSPDASETPARCVAPARACGSGVDESCCSSPLVGGGAFYRGYDGVYYPDQSHPATVSDFHLDRFEVTVGRFRRFVSEWVAGWRHAADDGRHTHLNGGDGLTGADGAHETGWDPAWSANLAVDIGTWNASLSCADGRHTWTPRAEGNEQRPLNCVSWYELYAFCIWDGGFLPSDAEWNYAAAGGDEQRVYPWGSEAPTPERATYEECTVECPRGVGATPLGDGKYGQADLAGNVAEWTFDWHFNPAYPGGSCNNCFPTGRCDACANLAPSEGRTVRGGSFYSGPESLRVSPQGAAGPGDRHAGVGGRCARSFVMR